LTEEKSRQLLDSGLTKLYFSVDAIKEETYKFLRKGGSLKQVTDNINTFLRLRKEKNVALPIIRVSFVKSKVNASEADEFVKYWEARVEFVSMQAFMPPALSHSRYNKIRETFYIENTDLKDPGPCPQPYQRLTIYHDGSVHPCCHWPGATLIVGNIYSDSIYAIWNSDKMEKIRIAANNPADMPKECAECRMLVFGKVN
jgi:radical SAM protein with 4Fe4S-binding SPASM domain